MTTWTSISNALVAVGAKPFATTIQALRDNIISQGEADATVPASQLPTVLLGTITTTSGSTQSLSGLVLTPYKSLKCFFNGVSLSSTTNYVRLNGQQCCESNTTDTSKLATGVLEIDLATGVWGSMIGVGSGTSFSGSAFGGSSGYSTATTTITFTTSGGNFDAGSIKVYGCK